MEDIKKIENTQNLNIPSFKVDCKKYLTPQLKFSPIKNKMILELVKIDNLDSIILSEREVSIEIIFPFKNPYISILKSDNGFITTKDLISFIRDMFFNCYRNLSSFPCDIETKGKTNELYELTYPIDCLFVESISFDKENKKILINSSGNPIIRKEPDYPF